MTKERTVNVEKITESLKRAAHLAVTGSRDDRNGRFSNGDAVKKPSSPSIKQSGKKT